MNRVSDSFKDVNKIGDVVENIHFSVLAIYSAIFR